MTLIVAHRDGWMIADRMTSFDNERMPIVVSKIVNLGFALVGAAGESGFQQVTAEVLSTAREETLIPNLSKFFRDAKYDMDVLVVNTRGELVYINGKGVVFELKPEQKWWTMGSGRDTAKGWLQACERYGLCNDMLQVAAIEALEYTSTVDACVGHGIQIERLRSPGLAPA